jgi:hypothetical protein
MLKIIASTASCLFFCLAVITTPVRADSEIESNFKDMFITAGYSAAAGAAIGAALLSFQQQPLEHLKYMSVGASIGFLGGMSVGSWIVFAPIFVENAAPSATPTKLAHNSKHSQFIIKPWLDTAKNSVSGLEAGLVFASF